MPWNPEIPPEVRTVHLGEFTLPTAVRIGEELDGAGIHWWTKEPGFLTQLWQRGIEVFVDRVRLDQARAIAAAIVSQET